VLDMGFFDKIKKALVGESKDTEEIAEPVVPDNETAPSSHEASEPAPDSPVSDEEVLGDEENQADALADSPEEVPTVQPPAEATITTQQSVTPMPETIPETIEKETVQDKYTKGLSKSRKTFGQRMNELFANFRTVDEDFFEEVEETLIGADVGFDAAMKIADALRQEVKLRNVKKTAEVQNVIIEKLVDLYGEAGVDEVNTLNMQPDLTFILFVGVNGVCKLSSI